jgi:mono/diheme cytochrome c family protein
MKKRIVASVFGCLLGLPGLAQNAEHGEELYVQYCAACHGSKALGDGPISDILLVKPSNLRRLSATNGGVFPARRVVMRIDGRDPLLAHGSMMPVYGHIFVEQDTPMNTETGQPILTSALIVDLVAYLEALQE